MISLWCRKTSNAYGRRTQLLPSKNVSIIMSIICPVIARTAKVAVLVSVPLGSTTAQDDQFMVQEDFQCVRTTNAAVAEQERVYHHVDYLSCDSTDSEGGRSCVCPARQHDCPR